MFRTLFTGIWSLVLNMWGKVEEEKNRVFR